MTDPFFTGRPPASFHKGRATVDIEFRIVDEDALKEAFETPLALLRDDHLSDILFMPFTEAAFGAENKRISLRHEGDRLHVTLSADITDPDLFYREVSIAGQRSGRDADWTPVSVEDALFEAFLGANSSASLVDYGLEY